MEFVRWLIKRKVTRHERTFPNCPSISVGLAAAGFTGIGPKKQGKQGLGRGNPISLVVNLVIILFKGPYERTICYIYI